MFKIDDDTAAPVDFMFSYCQWNKTWTIDQSKYECRRKFNMYVCMYVFIKVS